MGNFSNARVHYGLQITGTPTKAGVANDVQVGVSLSSIAPTGNFKGYTTRIHFGALGTPCDGLLTQNTWTPFAPIAQVETATAAGTVSASGNATVIVTGARIAGSPVTLSVPVLSGDTASTWAGKVRTALAANSAISGVYTVSGSTTSIVLTETVALYSNDATLNISLNNGTCAGITPALTSENTTEGWPGSILVNLTGDGKDFEGAPLGTITPKFLLVRSILGSADFYTSSMKDCAELAEAGDFALFKTVLGINGGCTIYPNSEAIIEITVLGTPV